MKILQSNVLRKFLFSYFILIVTVIGIFALLANEVITRTVEDEVLNINTQRLKYIHTTVEKSVLEPAQNMVIEHMMDSALHDVQRPYAHYELQKRMQTEVSTKPYIESIGAYYPGDRLLITSKGVRYDVSQDTLPLMRDLQETGEMMPGWRTGEEGVSVVYIRPSIILPGEDKPGFYLFASVSAPYVEHMLRKQLINSGEAVLVLDDSYRQLPVSSSDVWSSLDFGQIIKSADEGLSLRKIGSSEQMLVHVDSAFNAWHYVLLMPMKDFFRTSLFIRNVILYTSLIVLAVGLTLGTIFSFRQYKPVRSIVTNLQGGSRHPDTARNEYEFISSNLTGLYSSIEQLKRKMNQNQLGKALRGLLDVQHNEEVYELLPYPYFIVAAFQIRDLDASRFETLESCLNELCVNQDFKMFLYPYNDDILLAVYNYSEGPETIYGHLDKATARLSETTAFSYRCGVGGKAEGTANLYLSCEQALRALSYHFLMPYAQPVILYPGLRISDAFPMQKEHLQLIRSIESGSMNEIRRLFAHMRSGLGQTLYRYENVEYIVSRIIMAVHKKRIEADAGAEDRPWNDRDLMKDFYSQSGVFHALNWLESVIESILSIEKEEHSLHLMMHKVKGYIDEHYADEISLEVLSQKTFLSSSYISMTYKKVFGIGISEYVSQIRLEQARRMLEDEESTVEQIAAAVGLSNSTYFITKFKKKYGVTPNQYRLNFKSQQL